MFGLWNKISVKLHTALMRDYYSYVEKFHDFFWMRLYLTNDAFDLGFELRNCFRFIRINLVFHETLRKKRCTISTENPSKFANVTTLLGSE